MLPRVCSAAVLVVLLSSAAIAVAQPAHLGELFPLTSTRYGTARAHEPRLLSNGRDPVLFWTGEGGVRVSRLTNGRFGMSRIVADGAYDALWTRTHFLVVSTTGEFAGGLVARVLDATGEPRGEAVPIAAEGYAPSIAYNGRNVLLLYTARFGFGSETALHALLLNAHGQPLEPEPRSLGIEANGRVAMASNGDSFAALVPDVFDPPLLLFNAKGVLQSRTVFSQYGSGVALASDGRRYLGVSACDENGPCAPAISRLIEADGTIGAPVELDQPFHANPSIVWSGTKWIVAYVRDAHREDAAMLQLVQLDASARAVEMREEKQAIEASIAVVGNRVLTAWTTNQRYDVVHVGPLDNGATIAASFHATQQSLSAIEPAANGTLVVWQERGNGRSALFTGFRALDGSWSERELLSSTPPDCFYCFEEGVSVMLAGDGQQFLLHTSGPNGQGMQRLDSFGNPVGRPFHPFSYTPWHLLWTGRDYVTIYSDAVTRISAGGAITSTATLPAVVGQSPVFAADDDGGLIAVRVETKYVNHYPTIVGLSVVRLDRDLQPIDTTPIRLAADDQSLSTPSAGWDGRQYVVAWNGRDGLMAAQIARSGAANPKVVKLADDRAFRIQIEPVPGAAAIFWMQPQANRLAYLRHDGTSSAPLVVREPGYETGRIATLPNGDVAYAEASVQDAAPFERTSRVMFRTIGNAPPRPKPDAPRLHAQLLPSREVLLTWTAPQQLVSGFRIEASIDGGPWTEVAPLLSRDAREHRLTLEAGVRAAFRIRAWNEAGTGAYSAAVTAPPLRQRAVRK